MRSKMKVLGITGGIGSGKSTAAAFFRGQGISVIDADEIAREVLTRGTDPVGTRGTDLVDELKGAFGEDIFDELGNLDRKALANVVFSDPRELKRLNEITHPRIAVEIGERLKTLYGFDVELAVIDVALPIKDGFLDKCDRVWMIAANTEVRISRLMLNRGYSREECVARMSSQPSDEEYAEVSDLIIDNSGSQKELYDQLEINLRKLRENE